MSAVTDLSVVLVCAQEDLTSPLYFARFAPKRDARLSECNVYYCVADPVARFSVCGPQGLVDQVWDQGTKYARDGYDVTVHREVFAF